MSLSNRRRPSESICDSSLLTFAVFIPVALALYLYRQEPRKLFQILFGVFVLCMGFVMIRHMWTKIAISWKKKEEDIDTDTQPTASRDLARKEAVRKAQETHSEKAEDYERVIAAPRREKKLSELEAKMKLIQGFKGEGTALGGSTKSSRLLQSSNGNDVPTVEESDDSDIDENEPASWVTISLRLSDKSVKRKFRTSQKVKSLYVWLHSLGYPSKDYHLTTLIPKKSLTDQSQRLAEVGLVSDTILAVEEKDD